MGSRLIFLRITVTIMVSRNIFPYITVPVYSVSGLIVFIFLKFLIAISLIHLIYFHFQPLHFFHTHINIPPLQLYLSSETKKGSEIFFISLPQNRFLTPKTLLSSIKLDFLGLQKSPSKTARSLDFAGFAAMSSILITHPSCYKHSERRHHHQAYQEAYSSS